MESVVLIIHLVLAFSLIGVVLIQKSEGGGLGMGGGGGGGGLMSARGAATAMTKLTWGLAAAFIMTSVILTIIAKSKTDGSSALDNADLTLPVIEAPTLPDAKDGLLPPSEADKAPLTPVVE